MLDEMTRRNASKFVIFYTYENPKMLFSFRVRAVLFFPLMNALVYVDIDHGIHKVKILKAKILKMNNKKNCMGFLIHKLWQILKCFARSFHQA